MEALQVAGRCSETWMMRCMAGLVLTGKLSPRNIRPNAPTAKLTLLIYSDKALSFFFSSSFYREKS